MKWGWNEVKPNELLCWSNQLAVINVLAMPDKNKLTDWLDCLLMKLKSKTALVAWIWFHFIPTTSKKSNQSIPFSFQHQIQISVCLNQSEMIPRAKTTFISELIKLRLDWLKWNGCGKLNKSNPNQFIPIIQIKSIADVSNLFSFHELELKLNEIWICFS